MMTPSYERIAERLLSRQKDKAKPFCMFDTETKRLLTGTKSLHRTQVSRTWRLFWRLKYNRL